MYLKRLHIENNGALHKVAIEFPFTKRGMPKPVILVGGNGSGKTNLLSIIADALFEAAVTHYSDVVANVTPVNRPWFRFVGSTTVRLGQVGGFTILQFEDEGKTYLFREKAGKVTPSEAASRVAEELQAAADWPDNESNVKNFAISDEDSRRIFGEGVFAYFPSNRSEYPVWLNRESLPSGEFDSAIKIAKSLKKPIYVERSLDQFQQWLLSVILESRHELEILNNQGNAQFRLAGNVGAAFASGGVLASANEILRRVLGEQEVAFGWLGRHSAHKLGIGKRGSLYVPSLSALSSGQSTLLSIFGTILRYADNPKSGGSLPLDEISGICLVDEIDAHIHVDLQNRALPELIALFPKMQFVVSSHSPLFVLGMEKVFSGELVVVDMPAGSVVSAQSYAEFGRALKVLQETVAFSAAVEKIAGQSEKPLVFVEGETDPIYLGTATKALGRESLFQEIEIDWIGAKKPKNGQVFHTGKEALNHTLNLLRANPELVKREVLLLYDSDSNKAPEDFGRVHVRSLPANSENKLIQAGIENLLPESVITEDMFNKTDRLKPNGTRTTTATLDKMRLCRHLCADAGEAAIFSGFAEALDVIEEVVRQAKAD